METEPSFDINLTGDEEGPTAEDDLGPKPEADKAPLAEVGAEAGFDPNNQGAALDAQLDEAVRADERFEGDVLAEEAQLGEDPEEAGEPPVPAEPEAPAAEAPKPPKKRGRKKAAAPKPKPKKEATTASGPVARDYLIFQVQQAEVGGQIVEVPIQQSFSVNDEVLTSVRARNRDLALTRAARMYGEGFVGTLVAVPQSMWEPKPVRNKPKAGFTTQVGADE